VQEPAIEALAKAGKAGLPALLNVMKDKDVAGPMRRKALAEIQKMGREAAPSAVPAFTEVVKDPKGRDRQLKVDAVNALGAMAKASDTAAVKVLNDIVNDAKSRDMGLKNQCRRALGQIQKRK